MLPGPGSGPKGPCPSILTVTAFFLICLGFTPPSPAFGQVAPQLLEPEVGRILHEALSGERAKEYAIAISRFHRIQGSRGYRASAEYLLQVLRGAGFQEKEAFVESYPSDGRIHYQTWQSPSGWDMDRAELRMVEPYQERIIAYPEIAMSLMTYSNPGFAKAELVWVGPGTSDSDYLGKDVSGKIVLCTGYGGDVHRLAVLKYGAQAVVCYLDDERAMEFPDMLAYTGMWPRTEELEKIRFGFNLTRRQGERLRNMVESGQRVVLEAEVEGIGLEPYFLDVPVAVIPGSDPAAGELVFSGHLDHPKESANDNGSGSAAMMDMAITLRRLIETGRLPQPKRTLRFLWVPEFYGMMAYLDAHPEMAGPTLGGKTLGNINLDMVGENLEIIHTKMILTRTPASIPSVVNDVVEDMANMVRGMNVRTPRGSLSEPNILVTPYSGGSDHNVFIAQKIPGIMLGHAPDYTHHTSEDTPDKVDPVELERSEILAAATFWYLANLSETEATELAFLAGAKAAERLGEAAWEGVRHLLHAPPEALNHAWAEIENRIRHHLHWSQAAVRDISHFHSSEAVMGVLDTQVEALSHQADALLETVGDLVQKRGVVTPTAPSLPRPEDGRIPARLTRGPLAGGLPASRLPEDRAAWYSSPGNRLQGNYAFELVNFIDGRRTIHEIRDALSAEFGPIPTQVVSRFVEDLVSVGVVEWR